jgi:hypothetical protein
VLWQYLHSAGFVRPVGNQIRQLTEALSGNLLSADQADVRHAVVSGLLGGGQKINNPPNYPPGYALKVLDFVETMPASC